MVRSLVVLGTTGWVGSHVVDQARAEGWRVAAASVSGPAGLRTRLRPVGDVVPLDR